MSVARGGDESSADSIAEAERVAYLFVAPVILAVGLFGSAANLLVLSNKKRFDGRLFVYLRVSERIEKPSRCVKNACQGSLPPVKP